MLILSTDKTNYLAKLHALTPGTMICKHFAVGIKLRFARLAYVSVGIRLQRLVNAILFASARQQKQQAATDPKEPIKVSFFHRPVTIRAHKGTYSLWPRQKWRGHRHN